MSDLTSFDPDATGVANGNYFGFPFSTSQAALCLLSVPWDVTVSYREGTAAAPRAIIDASTQVEIYDEAFDRDLWRRGIATLPFDREIWERSAAARKWATHVIEHIENGGSETDACIAADLARVNKECKWLNDTVFTVASESLAAGRIVGLVGGDHSTPLGLLRALDTQARKSGEGFGVLHIDAHADLRDAYEGFEFSHASIMRNTLKLKSIERFVQVSVRDFSAAEAEFAASESRVVQFSDKTLRDNEFNGTLWADQCRDIIAQLPARVYVSFDIDGLEPAFCPSTGTPVPGGLSWAKAVFLLEELSRSGRTIVGFDLNEVAPAPDDEWDAIVGARLLYKLCLLSLNGTCGV